MATAHDLPVVSLADDLRFNALVTAPNVLQGLFRRRATAVLAATRLNVDGWAIGLVDGIRARMGPGPVWVHAGTGRALLVLTREDVRRVLEGSPDPFAPDPATKRKGMTHFQPDALTLSRGELWRNRRRFTEAVLDSREPHHRHAERFAAVARGEIAALVAVDTELRWDAWHAALRRIARRTVLGDDAADDEHVTDLLAKLMDEANDLRSEASPLLDALMVRLERYVDTAQALSLVSLFAAAPSDAATDATGQLPHWLFALADTLPINVFRALALLASHPTQRAVATDEIAAGGELRYVQACLQEAMRLWPTTPLLTRETLEDIAWNGATVPAGTQVLIFNTFNHRDPATHEFADRLAPEAWTDGDASDDWAFNHFSGGPQGCPGAMLALAIGAEALAAVLTAGEVRLLTPTLDPQRPLPRMLDHFRIRLELAPEPDR